MMADGLRTVIFVAQTVSFPELDSKFRISINVFLTGPVSYIGKSVG